MQKIHNNPKMNQEILRKLYQPAGNIAFLDAEFNAGMDRRTGENINDVISIGIVFCDEQYREIDRFYSLVQPMSGKPVFPMISRITGITTEMLKGQPNFAVVSGRITELVRKYEIRDVFAWGNADQYSLMRERSILQARHYASPAVMAGWNYIDLCTDISPAVSSQILGIRGGLAINMENLMFVCEIDEHQDHNAFSDAFYLYKCMDYLKSQYPIGRCSSEFRRKRELVNRFYQERSAYNSFRRFRATSKGSDLYGRQQDPELEKDIRIRALEDDLRFLRGEIPFEQEFDSIQEYFSRAQEENP